MKEPAYLWNEVQIEALMIRFVENLLKIIHYVVKARRRQEEYLDINTRTNKTRFSRCNDHAGDDSEFAHCNFSETLKQASNEGVDYTSTAHRCTHNKMVENA